MNTAIVVSAGIVVVLATIIVLVAARREPDGEHFRTVTRYLDSVSLLSVFAAFLVLMALAFGTYGIFRIAAPGVATSGGGSTERQRGIAQALSLLALAGGAALIFRAHWSDTMHPASRNHEAAPDAVMS